MTFKAGDLVRIKRKYDYIQCVNLQTADWYLFYHEQVALHLGYTASMRSVKPHPALILVEETKCYCDEDCLELVPIKNSL